MRRVGKVARSAACPRVCFLVHPRGHGGFAAFAHPTCTFTMSNNRTRRVQARAQPRGRARTRETCEAQGGLNHASAGASRAR